MKTRITVRAVAVIAGATALWGTMLPGGAGAEVPDDQVPAGLRAAIQAEVESRGETFAGMCREIVQHEHYGEWCAFVQEMDEDSADVTFGPVASDEISAQSFMKVDGEWTSGQSETPQETVIPAELRGAIKAFIEAKGKVYAGLCDEVQQTAQPGQYCASVVISGNTATVSYGPFASDEISITTFTFQNGAWKAANSVTPTAAWSPTPKPPSTGNGSEASDGMSNAWAAAGLATIGVAVAGLGGALAMRRRAGGR